MNALKKSVSYHAAKAMPAVYNINSGGKEKGRLNSVWGVSKVENEKRH